MNLPRNHRKPENAALRRLVLAGNLMSAQIDLHLKGRPVTLKYGRDCWESALAEWRGEAAPDVEEIEIHAPADPVAPASLPAQSRPGAGSPHPTLSQGERDLLNGGEDRPC